MTKSSSSSPVGIRLVTASPCRVANRDYIYRAYVLVFTFLVYGSFHMTRKAISVVKTRWNPECTNKSLHNHEVAFQAGLDADGNSSTLIYNSSCEAGWYPFDGDRGSFYLGVLDTVFLFAYAFAMFVSGHIGDRMNLTYFLTIGMLGTGIFTGALGIPYFFNLHSLWYFVIVQLIGGVFQSVGWPTVVAIMTKWFGKGNRGLIFGIWNSHTSVGNIVGAIIPAVFVDTNWGYAFIVPGLMMVVLGVLTFLFLPSDPEQVSVTPAQHHPTPEAQVHVQHEEREERAPLFRQSPSPMRIHGREDIDDMQSTLSQELQAKEKPQAIGFIQALTIPGVIEFSLSLFFAKLVAYTFLYWLPSYVKDTLVVDGKQPTDQEAADLSTFFDVGGIGGGILVGFLADRMGMNAVPCIIMQLLCIPALVVYNRFGGTSYGFCIGLSFLTGFLVNGPYCLITTAVSADLATHDVLKDNQEAKATVAAIIDGTGSIGAALGPLLTGWISGSWDWSDVFVLLMLSCGLAAVFLLRLVVKEIKMKWERLSQWLAQKQKSKKHISHGVEYIKLGTREKPYESTVCSD